MRKTEVLNRCFVMLTLVCLAPVDLNEVECSLEYKYRCALAIHVVVVDAKLLRPCCSRGKAEMFVVQCIDFLI